MAKKNYESAEVETGVPGSKFAIRSNEISKVVDQWIGQNPTKFSVDNNIKVEDIIHLDFCDILDREIIVLGFCEKTGEKNQFLVILALLTDTDEIITTCCGGIVVMKKVKQAGEKKMLPVKGKIIMPEGKNYYDFV